LLADVSNLDDRDRNDQTTVTRIESRCPPGRDVVLYRINAGGHRMPGAFADARFPRIVNAFLGPQTATSTAPRNSSENFREGSIVSRGSGG
jgi:poly(3-hydroxybutyrate) depolymerase